MESQTVYFENPGSENTETTLNIVKLRAKQLGIRNILIASTTGDTAVKAADILRDFRVTAVSHYTGAREPNIQEFTEKNREAFENKGGIILTTTHTFMGISRAVWLKFNTIAIGELIANVLRIFGEGIKVAIEISMMAADSGLVRTDEDVISIAGTVRGADSAILLRPVNTYGFFDLRIKEILCKPHF